jgi:CheY-like chemotaxis protein
MEDEEDLRVLLKAVLEKLGYEVKTAQDGAEAITLYESAIATGRCFDAAVLDLTVNRGMGGISTAARLKEVDPAAKLIVSTGYSDDPVMGDYHKYGFDDAIPKPWNVLEVSEVLKRVLLSNPDRKAS